MWSRSQLAIVRVASKLQLGNRAQAGFAVPLALGLGLVMIIVAASTIGRSQSDRNTTSSQQETSRALGISEAGVVRVQAFLDRYKLLATKNLDRWAETLDSLPSEQANCSLLDRLALKQQVEIFKNNQWIDLDRKDLNKGRYQIVDYRYQAGVGRLTVAGEIDVYNTTKNSAKNTLTVEIPIGSEDDKIPPPGLWAQTLKLTPSQQVTGNIRAVTCPQITATNPDGLTGVDRTNIAEVDTKPTGQIIADPFTAIPKTQTAPTNVIKLEAITKSIDLPRTGDNPNSDSHEYHYLVQIDSPSSNFSIKLNDTGHIKINLRKDDKKVNLYLQGNIDLAGGKITDADGNSSSLRIYGSEQTLKLIIKDNASINAFIHAPFADAQNIKSTSKTLKSKTLGQITGGVWVKSWDSVSSNGNISIVQVGNWSDFGVEKVARPAQLNPIESWQRVDPTPPKNK
jgi:hypothetical protein